MYKFLLTFITTALFGTGVVFADPISLTSNQMDQVTAGGLLLPNDREVFEGFDNPAPGEFHPNFGRSETANDATFGIPASGDTEDGFSGSNEGPWSAHFQSPVIDVAF